MRLGVVSDTHGHLEFTRAAIHYLQAMEVEEVVHCGDIDTPEMIDLFTPWSTHFVFGNCDHDTGALTEAMDACAKFYCHNGFGQIDRAGRTIAFLHGHDEARLNAAVRSGEYDLVCHGHTHVAELERRGDTLVLNPGALYRASPHSIAIVDLPELKVEHITV